MSGKGRTRTDSTCLILTTRVRTCQAPNAQKWISTSTGTQTAIQIWSARAASPAMTSEIRWDSSTTARRKTTPCQGWINMWLGLTTKWASSEEILFTFRSKDLRTSTTRKWRKSYISTVSRDNKLRSTFPSKSDATTVRLNIKISFREILTLRMPARTISNRYLLMMILRLRRREIRWKRVRLLVSSKKDPLQIFRLLKSGRSDCEKQEIIQQKRSNDISTNL